MRAAVVELSALVDKLEELIDEARVVPLTSQVRVERSQAKALIGQIRAGITLLQDS